MFSSVVPVENNLPGSGAAPRILFLIVIAFISIGCDGALQALPAPPALVNTLRAEIASTSALGPELGQTLSEPCEPTQAVFSHTGASLNLSSPAPSALPAGKTTTGTSTEPAATQPAPPTPTALRSPSSTPAQATLTKQPSATQPPPTAIPTQTPTVTPLPTLPATPIESARYVSPTGNDQNPGTLDQPWRTIQHAVDKAGPGTTVYIRTGVYNESVNLHCSGEETKPITLTQYQAEAVTIDGGNAPAVVDTTGTQFWAISGFTLQSAAEHTILLDAWGCSGLCGGTHHWRIANNRILGSVKIYGSQGVFEGNEVDGSRHLGNENGVWELYDSSHHNVFQHNTIHHFNERGLWSMHRTHDTLIENNHIYNIGSKPEMGMCIDTDGYGTVEWRHVIRGNHLHHCGESGIELENTFDSLVENNRIHDTGRRAIDVINYGRNLPSRADTPWPEGARCQVGGENNQYGDTDGNNDCEGNITGNIIRQNLIYGGAREAGIILLHAGGVKIWGNTVYGTQGAAVSLDSNAQFCPQIELRSNILAQSPVAVSLPDLTSLTADDHNLLFPTDPKAAYEQWNIGRYFSLANYQVETGLAQASVQSNPLLVNPGNGDFSPRPDSPTVDRGIHIGLDTDLNGVSRPQGNQFDIGAFELVR